MAQPAVHCLFTFFASVTFNVAQFDFRGYAGIKLQTHILLV